MPIMSLANSILSPSVGQAELPDQEEVLDDLAVYIKTAFRHAVDNKDSSGVQRRLDRALYSKNMLYPPDDSEVTQGIDVHMGVVAHICRGAKAWLVDILANNLEKPYTLKPTPEPEIPQEIVQVLVDELAGEIDMFGETPDLNERIKEMADIARDHVKKLAVEGVKRIEDRIDDQLAEANWRVTFMNFMDDLVLYPTAFIVGPEEVSVRKIEFRGNHPVEVDGINLEPRNVSPFDVFPSPDSADLQTGEYIIILDDYTYDDVYQILNTSGAEDDNIEYILDTFTGNSSVVGINNHTDEVEDDLTNKDQGMFNTRTKKVYKYYGKIPGRLLKEYGISVDDERAVYESVVWMIDDHIVKSALNAYPLQNRPIYGASIETLSGSVWGRGYYDILEPVERVANAAVRSMIKNMSFASGPLSEVDAGRFSASSAPDEIQPYAVYHVDPDYTGTGQPAIRFTRVPSISSELMIIYEKFTKIAEELSGIPGYVLGQPEVAGAGRTLGGLSLLMGNAAKGIKMIIAVIDKFVIEPMVEAYYMYNILYTDFDTPLVYDAQVVANGSNGILQRELSSGRAVELLQILTPFVQAGLIPAEGLPILLRQIINLMGFNGDDIIGIDKQASVFDQIQALLAPNANSAQPQLDNRSGAAILARQAGEPYSPAFPVTSALG